MGTRLFKSENVFFWQFVFLVNETKYFPKDKFSKNIIQINIYKKDLIYNEIIKKLHKKAN